MTGEQLTLQEVDAQLINRGLLQEVLAGLALDNLEEG